MNSSGKVWSTLRKDVSWTNGSLVKAITGLRLEDVRRRNEGNLIIDCRTMDDDWRGSILLVSDRKRGVEGTLADGVSLCFFERLGVFCRVKLSVFDCDERLIDCESVGE